MVTINCDLDNGDNPSHQIKSCIKTVNNIYNSVKSDNEVCLDLSNNIWMLPCSSLVLSHAIEDLRIKGFKINILEPRNTKLKNHLKQIGFPFGDSKQQKGCSPIVHFQGSWIVR